MVSLEYKAQVFFDRFCHFLTLVCSLMCPKWLYQNLSLSGFIFPISVILHVGCTDCYANGMLFAQLLGQFTFLGHLV
jgi:hypothetical protein